MKNSLFNKSIIKADLKRFWWISALYMLLEATMVLPNAVTKYISGEIPKVEYSYNTDNCLFAIVFAIFAAGILFSYLHKGSSVSEMHSMPLTRGQLFRSHIFSGMILLLTPIVISSLVILGECNYMGAENIFALKYFYTCLIYTITAFSATTLAFMISGNTIAGYIFTIGFMALPAYVLTVVDELCCKFLYGFNTYGNRLTLILNRLYLSMDSVCTKSSLLYIVLTAAATAAAYMLYRFRRLESYNELVVFNWLKPVFMYVVSICIGVFGSLILNGLLNTASAFWALLPLGIASVIGTNMFNKRSITFKGSAKYIAIYIAFAGVFWLCFSYDITGYETRVPSASKIAEATITDTEYSFEPSAYYDDYNLSTDADYDKIYPTEAFTSEKDLNNITAFHRAITEHRYDTDRDGAYYIRLEYKLKNGRRLERCYQIDISKLLDEAAPVVETQIYKKSAFRPLLDDAPWKCRSVLIMDYGSSIKLYGNEKDKIFESVKKDIQALTFEQWLYTRQCETGCSLEISSYLDENTPQNVVEFQASNTIQINRYFVNTIKVINELKASGTLKYPDYSEFSYCTALITNVQTGEQSSYNIEGSQNIVQLMSMLQDMNYINGEKTDYSTYYVNISLSRKKPDDEDSFDESFAVTKYYNEIPPQLKGESQNVISSPAAAG